MVNRAPDVILLGDRRVSDVLVQDCGESLVTTREAVTASAYLDRDGDEGSRWVRGNIRDRLFRATELLSPAYTLALEEGWRPLAV